MPRPRLRLLCQDLQWESLNLDELLDSLRILLSIGVFEIYGPHKMYWNEEGSNLFPSMNFEIIMSHTRLEEIARFLLLSFDQYHD